ncbi:ABC transporter [Streptomyces sedi]|uniref:ABC transporter n=1 Tax=Streptomyces sedi TaxID=555059 RepID=A0A5C4UTD3_9ACTN|nr:ABC transporter [Streptomyces sedi]TNM26199.1 ABC transporter [Streptomyces sedi]
MRALLWYQTTLLLRSRHVLPPALLHLAVLAVGFSPGDPILDSLAVNAAVALPTAVWLTWACTHNEPPAARSCTAAAASPRRAQLACLLTGAGAAGLLAGVCCAAVALLAGGHAGDRATAVSRLPALGAGLTATLVCVLAGTALGALCGRPMLRGRARAFLLALGGSVALLAAGASPANAAVSELVRGNQDGTVRQPLLPLLVVLTATALVTALACRRAERGE